MSKDKLVVRDHGDHYYISWFIVEDDDYGMTLGEKEYTEQDQKHAETEATEDPDLLETITACLLARELSDGRDTHGYYWEKASGAGAALRVVKARLKTLKDSRPWPEWALTAVKNGWTAPKGWKP